MTVSLSRARLIFLAALIAAFVAICTQVVSARTLTLISPNGGEWFEPGETAQIRWSFSGSDWQSNNTVKLEYSSDSGASWRGIQGANHVPYNVASYSWDTAGRSTSLWYRVRVTSNSGSASDASDANFAIQVDSSPPVITHTTLGNTPNRAGPYRVRAVITDNKGVASATLYWRRNGGSFTSTAMAASGVANEFRAEIPGPSVQEDQYCYYIEARDTSAAGYVTRSPSSAPGSLHCFSISSCSPVAVGQINAYNVSSGLSSGNSYYCETQSKLAGIEQYLSLSVSGEITYFVFESSTGGGPFTAKYTKVVAGAPTGARWHNSGPISVTLVAGYYYIIGVASQPQTSHYMGYDGHPRPTNFGHTISGYRRLGYPPSAPASYYADTYVYSQRLTACPQTMFLNITQPNGSIWYEPGQPLSIEWTATGSTWLPSDTVRLEYSTDGGSTWAPIPGAESLPYTAGSFAWNTAGYTESDQYMVRVTLNGDDSVSDASDANFTVRTDTSPPVIAHTRLADTNSELGPYRVCAQVTDQVGVGQVTLFWRRNGGSFNTIPMTPSGAPAGYCADIPGPGNFGDSYCYYIEARDTAATQHIATYPAGDPSEDCCFGVTTCRTDTIGSASFSGTETGDARGNAYECTYSSVLTQIEHYFNISTSTELRYCVYESTVYSGSYNKIHETVVADSGVGATWYSSGPISVPMQAGRYYVICTAWQGAAVSYGSYPGHPVTTSFGRSRAGVYMSYFPPGPTVINNESGTVYYQRVSACPIPRLLTITGPNGGEWFEPGESVEIRWTSGGPYWLPSNTVRLEYSTDGGSTWSQIPSAGNLPYNAGSFLWTPSGIGESTWCRVRVVYNGDAAVEDASDADFAIATDNIAPVISHAALADTPYLTGSYRVCAAVTDNYRVDSVTLYWSKNGGAFTAVSMSLSNGQYCADIPGPSLLDDRYCYYIAATDGSAAHNAAVEPSGGPSSTHCFSIARCGVDTIGGMTYTDSGGAYCRGNRFHCLVESRLTQIEEYLSIPSSVELKFVAYESDSDYWNYAKIHETTVASSVTGAGWYSSGPISVALSPGKYYIIAVGVAGSHTAYHISYQNPIQTIFGDTTIGYEVSGYPPPYTTSSTGDPPFYQRLSTCRDTRTLRITEPNGNVWHEPGNLVEIRWSSGGVNWQPDDTVRFEYSADSGATWVGIPGAEAVVYNSSSYNWDTTGCPSSDRYRVRVSFNEDPAINDVSDADFLLLPDNQPPVITHTPLPNTSGTSGRTVSAAVTDNLGVASVTLYWSKNGGAFTPVVMTYSSSSQQYNGTIPGGIVGDVIDYHLEAVDGAVARNTARHPGSGYHRYEVVPVRDYFTEKYLIKYSLTDLAFTSVRFTPDGSRDIYSACTSLIASLPTDPTGGTTLALSDNSYAQVNLTGGAQVSLYGNSRSSFFVGSNGYITLDEGDTNGAGDPTNHFRLKRVSGMFCDVNPAAGGSVSYKQTDDRVAITYLDIPDAYTPSNRNTFQIELFFNGEIRLSYLAIAGLYQWIAGLSEGQGIPYELQFSDLSAYPPCCMGDIAVNDSLPPQDDLRIPFGAVALGSSHRETARVRNTGSCDATLTDIRLASYAENFDDGLAQDWQEDWDAGWTLSNGQYQAVPPYNRTVIATYSRSDFSDFFYSATVRGGSAEGPVIAFRYSSDFSAGRGSGYWFGIRMGNTTQFGYYIRRQVNGNLAYIRNTTPTMFIRDFDARNTLAVNAVGSTLQFYINGNLVDTVTDSMRLSGRVGLVGPAWYTQTNYYYDDVFVAPPLAQSSNGVSGFKLDGVPTLPITLAPGQETNLGVIYQPQTAGHSQATLMITTLGAEQPSTLVELSGSGATVDSLCSLKLCEDGARAETVGKQVSAVFGDCFYIQDEKRMGGIGVRWSQGMPAVGDLVDVSGLMTTYGEERMIDASVVTVTARGSDPRPLGLNHPLLGGKPYSYQAGPPPRGQVGVAGAQSINNIGLLVRVWGKVTQIGPDYLYVHDGSPLTDGTTTGADPNTGVRVACDPTGYMPGDFVQVTGISSCFRTAGGQIVRRVLARGRSDIVLIKWSDTAVASIGAVRRRLSGAPARLSELVVTATPEQMGGFLYAQDLSRMCGIRIGSNAAVEVGDIITVNGVVGATSGRRSGTG
ncbi:MAG: hypothetical protein Q7T82_07120 [Armatimonadota bacterium]|nr:hypothetical protein [Armatimonadota bacterium]